MLTRGAMANTILRYHTSGNVAVETPTMTMSHQTGADDETTRVLVHDAECQRAHRQWPQATMNSGRADVMDVGRHRSAIYRIPHLVSRHALHIDAVGVVVSATSATRIASPSHILSGAAVGRPPSWAQLELQKEQTIIAGLEVETQLTYTATPAATIPRGRAGLMVTCHGAQIRIDGRVPTGVCCATRSALKRRFHSITDRQAPWFALLQRSGRTRPS